MSLVLLHTTSDNEIMKRKLSSIQMKILNDVARTSIIIKKIEPKEVLKNKKTSATKTKEVRGVNEKRNKSKKVRTKTKFVIYIYIYIYIYIIPK